MRAIKLFLILSFILLVVSCNMKPFNVMNKEKMADVLFDIHMTEASISVHDNGFRRLEKQTYYESVFKKYGINKEEFDKSVAWYSNNPKKYDEVYVIIKQKLDEQERLVK